MTVCNATAGNLSSLLLGRLELWRGWGGKGVWGGESGMGTRWGDAWRSWSRATAWVSPGARQSPAKLRLGGRERGSGCRRLPRLMFSQLLWKFYVPGWHGDPELSITGQLWMSLPKLASRSRSCTAAQAEGALGGSPRLGPQPRCLAPML